MQNLIIFCWLGVVLGVFFVEKEQQKSYETQREEIRKKRLELSTLYQDSSCQNPDSVLEVGRGYLLKSIDQLLPYWYGTAWDFNGTTRTPQQGKIACGYFITNTLLDLDFDIPRYRWAQMASETFIKKIATKPIKRFWNVPIEDIETYLLRQGDGLYVVGMDSHVGYLRVKKDEIQFIHANYYEPESVVVAQALDAYHPLLHSQYCVIGKLFDDEMLKNWLVDFKYH